MSTTITCNAPSTTVYKTEPCLCSQLAPSWGDMYSGGKDTPAIRAELAQHAFNACHQCAGTGVEAVPVSDAPCLNWNGNGATALRVLGLESTDRATIPEARRALMKARALTKLDQYARPAEVVYGKPRRQDDGTIELKPVRFYEPGLSTDRLAEYLAKFGAFVEEAAARGATQILWD